MSFSKMNDTSILNINKVSSISMENIGKINNHVLNQEVSIQLVGLTSSYEDGSSDSMTVDKPIGVQVNDFIILFFANLGTLSSSQSGWTQLYNANVFSRSPSLHLFYRIANIDEPISYTINNKSYHKSGIMCLAFRNVDISSPIGAARSNYDTSSSSNDWNVAAISVQAKNWSVYYCSVANEQSTSPSYDIGNSSKYTLFFNTLYKRQWFMYREHDIAESTTNIRTNPSSGENSPSRTVLNEIIKA